MKKSQSDWLRNLRRQGSRRILSQAVRNQTKTPGIFFQAHFLCKHFFLPHGLFLQISWVSAISCQAGCQEPFQPKVCREQGREVPFREEMSMHSLTSSLPWWPACFCLFFFFSPPSLLCTCQEALLWWQEQCSGAKSDSETIALSKGKDSHLSIMFNPFS